MTPEQDEENRRAKLGFIRAFFEDLDDKIAFLDDLNRAGRRVEARVLCSCYIDGLASALYWPEERSNYNFVQILKEHGGEEIFSYIHSKKLEDEILNLIERGQRKWRHIYEKISSVLQRGRERLSEEQEIITLLSPLITDEERALLKKEMWRGTFAAIVYNEVRIPSAHGFGPPDGITFEGTTFRDQPVPPIEFPMLRRCLSNIASAAKEKSLRTEKWFGHDFDKLT